MSDFSPCINYKCKAHSVVWEAPQAEEAGLLILLLLLFASARVVLLVVVVMVSVGLGGCSCACGCICGCGCWCGCGAPLLKDKRASTAWAYQRKELIKRTPRQTDRRMERDSAEAEEMKMKCFSAMKMGKLLPVVATVAVATVDAAAAVAAASSLWLLLLLPLPQLHSTSLSF